MSKRCSLPIILTLGLLLLSLSLVFGFEASTVQASSFLSGTYTNTQGTRPYKLYVPTGYTRTKAFPLLVVLHGCSQDPDNIATGTRFNTLADTYGFLVLYPQQTSTYNTSKCWNWFEPTSQARGSGEPAIIVGMVDFVRANYNIDSSRMFVTGISAGGAMSSILGACYPDYFAAIGVHSGIEYKGGTDLTSGLLAMEAGGPDPDQQGGLAYLCAGAKARVLPVIVFHGSLDTTVNPVNGEQVIRQFAQTNDYADDRTDNNSITANPNSTSAGQVNGGYSYTVTNYLYKGQLLMQKYLVTSMGHAWSGGSTASPATYTDPKGPDASTLMWQFFASHPKKAR